MLFEDHVLNVFFTLVTQLNRQIPVLFAVSIQGRRIEIARYQCCLGYRTLDLSFGREHRTMPVPKALLKAGVTFRALFVEPLST